MIITTTPSVEGYKISEYKGLVFTSVVVGVNFIAESIAALTDLFGGNSGQYRQRLDDMYSAITKDLENKARTILANAVVGVRIDFEEITGKGMSMLMATASGTAVLLVPDRLQLARQLHEIKLYKTEGILSEEEFEYEKKNVIESFDNPIAVEIKEKQHLQKVMEENARIAAEKKAQEEAHKLDMKKKAEEMGSQVEHDFFSHKNDVFNLTIKEIENATYEGKLPNADVKIYDAIRYLISKGEAAAAGKLYVDKYNLSPNDAIEYMTGIFKALE